MKGTLVKHKRWFSIFLFIIFTVVINKYFDLNSLLTREKLLPLFKQNLTLMIVGYISLFTLGNILLIPGWVFLAASVYALGTIWGFTLTLCAAYISVIVGYFIIGKIGKDSLTKVEKPLIRKMLKRIHERPLFTVIILRLVFQTAPFLNYALSLSRVPFRHYLLGSIISLPPVIFLYAYFIDKVVELLAP